MSLLWQETGAPLMLVHLTATDLHLGSCLVGTCGVLYPIGPTPGHPVDLGAVVIGTSDLAAGQQSRDRRLGGLIIRIPAAGNTQLR